MTVDRTQEVKTAQSRQIEGRTFVIKTLKYKTLKNSADFKSKYLSNNSYTEFKMRSPFNYFWKL